MGGVALAKGLTFWLALAQCAGEMFRGTMAGGVFLRSWPGFRLILDFFESPGALKLLEKAY